MARLRPGQRRPGGGLAALLALLLLLAGPAAAQALRAPAGVPVRAGDPDAAPGPLSPLPGPAFCFSDLDGNGTYDRGEAVVLAPSGCAGARLRAGDVRLTGRAAGERLAAGDPEVGRPASPLAWAVRFRDVNRDGQWSAGDALFLQPAAAAAVEPGHVRLTPSANATAGAAVQPGDADVGAPTSARVSSGAFEGGPGAWRSWDTDRDGAFSAADVLYADLDGSGDPTVGDVRGTPWAGRPFGATLAPGDPDAAPRLTTFGPAARLCFLDRDADAVRDAGEPVYFRYEGCPPPGQGSGAPLRARDVRLTGAEAGTLVAPGDSDEGALALLLPGGGALRYADLRRDGRWDDGDTLYLHASADRTTVTEGDVRLTGYGSFPAGSSVAPGDSDLKFLTHGAQGAERFDPSPGTAWRWWDGDGDLRFGAADVLYVDVDGDNRVGLADVRLSPLGGRPFGSPVRIGDPDVRPALLGPFPHAALCFVDADRDGLRGAAEAVLFQARPCGAVQPGDLRLDAARLGTKVRAGDAEANATSTWLPGLNNVRFFDADGAGTWGPGDTAYVHLVAGATSVVVGDLRFTAYGDLGPGTTVGPKDEDRALPTQAFPLAGAVAQHWRAWDLDLDGRFGGDDMLYVDADASGAVGVFDLRLTELRRNVSALPVSVAQIPELQRTIESLERVLGLQGEELRALREALEAHNRTLAAAQEDAERLAAQNRQLQAELDQARAAPPREPSRTPGPGAAAAVLALAFAGAALASRRR